MFPLHDLRGIMHLMVSWKAEAYDKRSAEIYDAMKQSLIWLFMDPAFIRILYLGDFFIRLDCYSG